MKVKRKLFIGITAVLTAAAVISLSGCGVIGKLSEMVPGSGREGTKEENAPGGAENGNDGSGGNETGGVGPGDDGSDGNAPGGVGPGNDGSDGNAPGGVGPGNNGADGNAPGGVGPGSDGSDGNAPGGVGPGSDGLNGNAPEGSEPGDRPEPWEGKLPSSYDGRLTGRAPSIKNQGSLGTCWAFASLMALEARLLPQERYDFSEDHISLNNGFCIPQEEGGEYTMSMAYLLSWRGPVLEEEDPYGDGESPDGLKAVKHVQGIEMVPAKDYEKIKRAILQYGGVQSSLYTSMTNEESRSVYYNEEKFAYCYLGSEPPNHDSVIIGWDDNFPKENFNVEVNGDGAFICMNSWGDNFGDNGYFYVSYYDSNIGMNNLIYTVVEEPDNYSHNYQTDLRGWVGQLGYGKDTAWFANVYEAEGAESLEAAGFYATDRHTSYEIYVVRRVGEESDIIDGIGILPKDLTARKRLAASGEVDYAGFYTIPLSGLPEKERRLEPGERFAVLVKMTTPGIVHPVAI